VYKVNINGKNPFAIMGDQVIGVTPWAPARLLKKFEAAWAAVYSNQPDRDWVVHDRYHVLLIGEKYMCECWPFRKTGTCKHIDLVKEEQADE